MIRVTFADGYEDREDDSPCIANVFEPVLRHPSEERWYLYFPGAHPAFSFCARNVIRLSDWRGGGALVWRITSAANEPLAGQWAPCRVESYPEQIARLTAENERLGAWAKALMDRSDACAARSIEGLLQVGTEKARADAAEKRLTDLRAWAGERNAAATQNAVSASVGPQAAARFHGEQWAFSDVLARIDGEDGESK